MKKTFLLAGLLAASAFSFAQTLELVEKVVPQKGKVIIPFEKYKMSNNDLTLIIHEDHSDPIVHHPGPAPLGPHRTPLPLLRPLGLPMSGLCVCCLSFVAALVWLLNSRFS